MLFLKLNDYNLIFDPWISKGIFDGGWAPYPPIKNPKKFLENVTHCFMSHIHTDHFDPDALSHLSKSTKMYVPENFPNHLMLKRLESLYFYLSSALLKC